MVRGRGFEPPSLAAPAPQAGVFTGFPHPRKNYASTVSLLVSEDFSTGTAGTFLSAHQKTIIFCRLKQDYCLGLRCGIPPRY